MKVSREVAAQNRQRILDSAGRLFREHGFDGVGIADIMRDCGLTHGGFYGQFASKEALAAEAVHGSLERAAVKWRRLAAEEADATGAILRDYVSLQRDDPGTGCMLAAVGPDCARKGGETSAALTAGLEALATILADTLMEEGEADAARARASALALLSQMVGAVILARAVDDPELSRALLDATLAERLG